MTGETGVPAAWSRVGRLQAAMRDQDLDAVVLSRPQSVFHQTGFHAGIYSHPVVAVLGRAGGVGLAVHALRKVRAEAEGRVDSVSVFGHWGVHHGAESWQAAVAMELDRVGAGRGRVGFEGEFMSVAAWDGLREALPGVDWRDASGAIKGVRLVKDEDEVANLRHAATFADRGMAAALEAARARRSEAEIAGAAMIEMQRLWQTDGTQASAMDFGHAEGGVLNGLWCYCLSGTRIALNCAPPTARVARKGEFEWIVIWSVYNGMHVENERCIVVDPGAEQRAIFEKILRIRAHVKAAVQPGATCDDVARVAREQYEKEDVSQYLPGRVGHGVGLSPHEEPSLARGAGIRLEPGVAVTVEPNLRMPEIGGCQHSDTVLVTTHGYESLTLTENGLLTT